MAVGQAGAVLALGLDTIEQAHTRQLAAAQRHQTAGLVPAYVQGLIAVVKNHNETIFHVGLDHILLPEDIESKHRGNAAANEPPGRHTRHKTHADKNEHEHQSAAHIGGYGIVQAKDHHQVRAQKQHIRDLLQGAVLLQPHQLPGQYHDEGQLHHLGRLHHHRQQGKFQPCQIAGVTRPAQRCFQQEDKSDAEHRQPQPAFFPHHFSHVDHGEHKKQHHADQRAHGLHQHKAHRIHIAGSGVDHQNTVSRSGAAERQQNKICLPKDIPYEFPHTLHESFLRGGCSEAHCPRMILYIVPQELFGVNLSFPLFFLNFL